MVVEARILEGCSFSLPSKEETPYLLEEMLYLLKAYRARVRVNGRLEPVPTRPGFWSS